MTISQTNKRYMILFLIYCITNILNFLNYDGIYWDDYSLIGHDYSFIHNIFNQATGGLDFISPIHGILLYFDNSIVIYRFITYFSYFFTGILIFKILQSLDKLRDEDIFCIVLLYLVIPLNSAKIALINLPSNFYLLLFFIAFFLFVKYIQNSQNIFKRILIYILFFLSFSVNSLLVFYGLVLLYALQYEFSKENFKIKSFLFKYIDFILLPIIYWLIKINYFPPYGAYENYNSIHFDLIKLFDLFHRSIYSSFYEPAEIALLYSYKHLYFFTIVLLGLLYIFRNLQISKKISYTFIFIGISGFLFAVFPYIMVGKLPRVYDWDSRHQLLMPLGISILVYTSVQLMRKINNMFGKILLLSIISVFIMQSFYTSYRYNQDIFYQYAIENHLKKSELVKTHTTFLTDRKIMSCFSNYRTVRDYEYNGFLKNVFKNEKRAMFSKLDTLNYYKNAQKNPINAEDWVYKKPVVFVDIDKNKKFELNYKTIVQLFYYKFFNKEKFDLLIEQLITLKAHIINEK
ncbi:hypothetical protein [Sulfurimonas sp. HSL-1716]|uniref:hypothetical protein n=1 Tax=Hydrocurvibacter sulfurireducens TaxID=3131937 RepID=UPI0031F750D1